MGMLTGFGRIGSLLRGAGRVGSDQIHEIAAASIEHLTLTGSGALAWTGADGTLHVVADSAALLRAYGGDVAVLLNQLHNDPDLARRLVAVRGSNTAQTRALG